MRIHLVTGGARSGKSRHAEQLAAKLSNDGAVTYIATAQAGDAEMQRRIALHQSRRPSHWETIESTDIATAIASATTTVVLLDCLTLLCSNVFLAAAESGEQTALTAVARGVDELLHAAQMRDGELVIVTNEVGYGIVPDNEYGRWFRDALGMANCRVAAVAETVELVVAGRALRLEPARA